jgi:hypothetical protein
MVIDLPALGAYHTLENDKTILVKHLEAMVTRDKHNVPVLTVTISDDGFNYHTIIKKRYDIQI